MATAESSADHRPLHIESLPLIDLRLLSQSELYSLSLSTSSPSASHLHRRSDDDSVIPKIDRSVFNESAGSRKQTFSRLRLAPRNKQIPPVPTSNLHIPLNIPEPVDEENAQIISVLQQLFGVESSGNAKRDDDCLVPVQVEFKDPLPESAALAFQNIPIDVIDDSQRKRKRGRPRKNEDAGIRVESETKKVGFDGVAMTMVNDKGFVVDAVALANVGDRDPFGEELYRRTQGLETEPQLLEFMERLNGEWGSQRKKRKIVPASDLGDLLPRGWKIVLSLKRRAGRAWIDCRRYVSPEGHQFESCKEASTYLLSLFGVQDTSHLKSSYTHGGLQFSSNINLASESQGVGHVPTGERSADDIASCLPLARTSVRTDYEKQGTISSSIGNEKPNTSDGNFNSVLALGSKIGDRTSGPFTSFDHQSEDKQLLMADKNDANSVKGCSFEEDRVHNVHNEKLADAIVANDGACNLYIPLVVTTPFSNNNSGICQFSDKINAVKCIESGISNFASQDGNTGCYETIPCGNEGAHVDNNGHWLSVSLVEDHRQKIGFESSMLAPNAKGIKLVGNSLEDRHLISSLLDMEISDGRPVEDDKWKIISSTDQSVIKNVSTNVKLPSRPSSLVLSQNEFGHTSINSTNSVSDNHAPSNEGVVTICAQERSTSNDQNYEMDDPLHRSSERNSSSPTNNEHSSAFDGNMNKVSAGTFDALKAVGAGCKKPQLEIFSGSSDVAVDACTTTSIMQGGPEDSMSVPVGGSILTRFHNQSHDVNNANESYLSEKAKSEQVEIFQSDSASMPEFR